MPKSKARLGSQCPATESRSPWNARGLSSIVPGAVSAHVDWQRARSAARAWGQQRACEERARRGESNQSMACGHHSPEPFWLEPFSDTRPCRRAVCREARAAAMISTEVARHSTQKDCRVEVGDVYEVHQTLRGRGRDGGVRRFPRPEGLREGPASTPTPSQGRASSRSSRLDACGRGLVGCAVFSAPASSTHDLVAAAATREQNQTCRYHGDLVLPSPRVVSGRVAWIGEGECGHSHSPCTAHAVLSLSSPRL